MTKILFFFCELVAVLRSCKVEGRRTRENILRKDGGGTIE
jgi:hypothetical protein